MEETDDININHFINLLRKSLDTSTQRYDKNKTQTVKICANEYRIKVDESLCKNLSSDHQNFILTFHNIDDHEFKTNLKINASLNIQSSTMDMLFNGDINVSRDESNRYTFSMNIKKIQCPYGIHLYSFTPDVDNLDNLGKLGNLGNLGKESQLLINPLIIFNFKFE